MAEDKIHAVAIKQAVTDTRIKTLEETVLLSHSDDINKLNAKLDILISKTDAYRDEVTELEKKFIEHHAGSQKNSQWLAGIGTIASGAAVSLIILVLTNVLQLG